MLNQSNLRFAVSLFGTDYVIANESSGEVAFHCPYCPSKGKRNNDRKLYVNVNKLVYDCKRCGAKGYIGSKERMLTADTESLQDMLKGKDEGCPTLYRLPKDRLADFPESDGYKYMSDRGFTVQDMIKYSMRLPGIHESALIGRVVVPNQIFYGNYTDMFTARTFTGQPNRYYNPPNSQKSKLLFGMQNVPENPEYLILNEGPLNSIIAGDCSVASYGKALSNTQFRLIKDLHPKDIYISYDQDADEQSESLCRKFLAYTDITPHMVRLPDNRDAVDLGRERYLDIVLNTKKFGCYSTLLNLLEGWLG